MPSLTQVAPGLNAYSFAFDAAILAGLQALYRTRLAPLFDTPEVASLLDGGENRFGEFATEPSFFYATYGAEPLLWVSNNDWDSYGEFKTVFEAMAIAPAVEPLVDHRDGITLYSGFFVVGHHADNVNWHLDYAEGANAYTLIAPLFPLDPGHGNLLFRDDESGEVHTYPYRLGEAIILGDRFPHSTEPYARTGETRVLLSMTFGTDKLEYWDTLRQTIGGQSKFLILPCGHRLGECRCLEG